MLRLSPLWEELTSGIELRPQRCQKQPSVWLTTARRLHLPDTPPYVVRCPRPMEGQGVPSALSPISPDTVLVAVTPSAPPVWRLQWVTRKNPNETKQNEINYNKIKKNLLHFKTVGQLPPCLETKEEQVFAVLIAKATGQRFFSSIHPSIHPIIFHLI